MFVYVVFGVPVDEKLYRTKGTCMAGVNLVEGRLALRVDLPRAAELPSNSRLPCHLDDTDRSELIPLSSYEVIRG